MPAPTRSEPSTVRMPPQSIRTQLANTADPLDETQTPPSAGPGAFDLSVIPPSHDDRTIILCFDGTGDQFDADVCADTCSQCSPLPQPTAESLLAQNSNIIQLFSMLKKDDKSQQVVYYQVCISAFFLSRDVAAQTPCSRLALGRTLFRRLRHRSGQTCKRRSTWPLPTTLMPM